MRPFHEVIDERRRQLGYTYEAVCGLLERYPWSKGVKAPSLPTVGHWSNGIRRPRHMEHLRGLCEVLQLTIDEAAPGGQVSAITDTEAALLRIVRTLSDEQAQALLAVAHTMRRD